MDNNTYEADLAIDPSALDVEWLAQANLYSHYATIAAEARRTVDAAKHNMEVEQARSARSVRRNPQKFGIEKLTEAQITEAVTQDDDVCGALEIYNQLKFELELAQVAVRSFEQRKSALQNCVQLASMDFFSTPRLDRDLIEEWNTNSKNKTRQEATDIVKDAMHSDTNKRPRKK